MILKVLLLLTILFLIPVESIGVATVTISATVEDPVGISASPIATLLTVPGQVGGYIIPGSDTPNSNILINFGNLTNGDNSNSTAIFGLRVRGNEACHITSSVVNFNARNIRYKTYPITNISDMTMIKIGTLPAFAAANGNLQMHHYDPFWNLGTNSLATLNSGIIGAVDTEKQKVCYFTDSPSSNGNLQSPDNYIESQLTFTIPTGFVWSPINSTEGIGNFIINLQFEIFSGV